MDWLSLIPAALGALGGLFGWGKSPDPTTTTTTTPVVDPTLTAAQQAGLAKAQSIFGKPYTPYTGQRVAAPTASRTAVDPMMAALKSKVTAGLNDSNGYQNRISQLLNAGPGRVQVPSMLQGNASTYTPGSAPSPVPVMPPGA